MGASRPCKEDAMGHYLETFLPSFLRPAALPLPTHCLLLNFFLGNTGMLQTSGEVLELSNL